jgi:O-antigen/teichoic acid export membrane protein
VLLTGAALWVAPLAFRFFYGESFMMSVRYVYGLFAYGALFGIGVGLGPMWRAVNKVRVSILINLSTLGAGVPLGLYLIKNWGLWGSVMMVTIWYSVSHFISFFYLARLLHARQRHAN